MKRGKYVLGVVLILVVAATAMVAGVVTRAPSSAEASQSTEDVIPDVIPPQGVTLLRGSEDVTLMPAPSDAASAITPEQALSMVHKPGNAVGNPSTLLAVVTLGASLPSPGESAENAIQDRLVWVVVYTVPPHDVRIGGRFIQNSFPVIRSHVVSLIDAQTGQELVGFFTK